MLRVMLIAHLVISALHGPVCAEKCLQLEDLDHVQLAPWSLMTEDESSSTTINVQYQGIMWQVDHWTLAVNLSWTGLAPVSREMKYLTGFTYTIDGLTANNGQIPDGQTTDGQIASVVLPLMSENDPAKNNCIILPHSHPDLNMALWRVDLGSCDCNFQPISCVKSCTVHRLTHRNVGLDACYVWLRQNKQRVRMFFRALLISRKVVEFHIRAQNINPYSHVSVAVFDDAMVANVKPLVEHSVDQVVNGEFSAVLTMLNSVRGADFYAKVTMRCGQDHFLDYETDLTHRLHTTANYDPDDVIEYSSETVPIVNESSNAQYMILIAAFCLICAGTVCVWLKVHSNHQRRQTACSCTCLSTSAPNTLAPNNLDIPNSRTTFQNKETVPIESTMEETYFLTNS